MLTPDFSRYTLALFSEGQAVFTSDKKGIRPLVECIRECKDKFSGCLLHDKVTGLAAARLVVFSGMISEVVTGLISAPALELLREEGIKVSYDKKSDIIMNRDGTGRCPMESRAEITLDNESFFYELNNVLMYS
jgi:hypothetical protein